MSCYAVQTRADIPTFRRDILPLSSGLKTTAFPSKLELWAQFCFTAAQQSFHVATCDFHFKRTAFSIKYVFQHYETDFVQLLTFGYDLRYF
jgi:hypothetical protein